MVEKLPHREESERDEMRVHGSCVLLHFSLVHRCREAYTFRILDRSKLTELKLFVLKTWKNEARREEQEKLEPNYLFDYAWFS